MKIDINKAIQIKKDILNLLKTINEYKIQLSKTVKVKENNLNNNSDYSEGIEDLLNTKVSITDAKKGEKMSPEEYFKRYGHYRKDDIPTVKSSKKSDIQNTNKPKKTKNKAINKAINYPIKDINYNETFTNLLKAGNLLETYKDYEFQAHESTAHLSIGEVQSKRFDKYNDGLKNKIKNNITNSNLGDIAYELLKSNKDNEAKDKYEILNSFYSHAFNGGLAYYYGDYTEEQQNSLYAIGTVMNMQYAEGMSGYEDYKNGAVKSNIKLPIKELNRNDINGINLSSGLLQSMLIMDNLNASNKKQMSKLFLEQAEAETADTDNIIIKTILDKMGDIVNGRNYKSKVEAVKSNIDNIENPNAQQTAFYIVNETPVIDTLKTEYKGVELANERDVHKLKDYIYDCLMDGAKSIFGFSSIGDKIRYSKEEDSEIIDLINKIGVKDTTFRGEGYGPEFIENIKIGQSYNDISKLKVDYDPNNQINSSNISQSISVAMDYASGDTSVVNIFLNSTYIKTTNLSFYGKNELEGFIDKRKQILKDVYKDSYGKLYLIYEEE